MDLRVLKVATAVAGRLPTEPLLRAASVGGRLSTRVKPAPHGLVENLDQIGVSGADLAPAGIGSYARYWAESLKIPGLSVTELDRRFSFINYHHILDAKAKGVGPIIALPHLGQWEWAAAWLARIEHGPVVAVVERLEPPELFDWFVELRESYGVNVVPLGSGAMGALTRAVRERRTICLLSDRDIQGNGVEVEFFGATTTLPAGPALLSVRTGAPVIPVAVFQYGSGVRCELSEPIWPGADGSLKQRMRELTQQVAVGLEELISRAPEQWHVLSPIWNSGTT